MQNKKTYFIAGTDTDVGKTEMTVTLLEALKARGHSPIAMKPLASGSIETPAGRRNEDAMKMMAHNAKEVPYTVVCPIGFDDFAAPHLIVPEGESLTKDRVLGHIDTFLTHASDYSLLEGVGGWRVPLNDTEAMPDIVKALKIPVIVVSGIRLGCLNHTILTVEAVLKDGLTVAGWIANCITPEMNYQKENIDTLRQHIKAPLLGVVPYQDHVDARQAAAHLDISVL